MEDIRHFLLFLVCIWLFITQSKGSVWGKTARCEKKDSLNLKTDWWLCRPISRLQWVPPPLWYGIALGGVPSEGWQNWLSTLWRLDQKALKRIKLYCLVETGLHSGERWGLSCSSEPLIASLLSRLYVFINQKTVSLCFPGSAQQWVTQCCCARTHPHTCSRISLCLWGRSLTQ